MSIRLVACQGIRSSMSPIWARETYPVGPADSCAWENQRTERKLEGFMGAVVGAFGRTNGDSIATSGSQVLALEAETR